MLNEIHEKIAEWGKFNKRKFSWRNTSDPYKIMIAEIMLHRTKASQVEPVYIKFVKKYPDFNSICISDPHEILSDLKGLGLKWRAKLLHKVACEIKDKYKCQVPTKKEELLKLPGIGLYIASAVMCFAYDIPEPLLDTNTVRVVGRVFGLEINDSSRRNKLFESIMKDLSYSNDLKHFLFSLIDFSAIICKSKNPKCNICPIKDICRFYKRNDNEEKDN